jgi:hypothetical protein
MHVAEVVEPWICLARIPCPTLSHSTVDAREMLTWRTRGLLHHGVTDWSPEMLIQRAGEREVNEYGSSSVVGFKSFSHVEGVASHVDGLAVEAYAVNFICRVPKVLRNVNVMTLDFILDLL